MNIDLYMPAWNEEKILPFTLDYYSRFCNRIFIYDNMSNDNSLFFYRKYKNVSVQFFETQDTANANELKWIKSLAYRNFSRDNKTDWAIICDCDEILWHEDILSKLDECKKRGIDIIECDGREMVSDKFPHYNGKLITDIVKTGSPTNVRYLSKAMVINPNIEIDYKMGSHSYRTTIAPRISTKEFKLLHYKYMGLDYVLNRNKQLYDRRSEFNRANNLSLHWSRENVEKTYINLMNNNEQIID